VSGLRIPKRDSSSASAAWNLFVPVIARLFVWRLSTCGVLARGGHFHWCDLLKQRLDRGRSNLSEFHRRRIDSGGSAGSYTIPEPTKGPFSA